MNLPAMPAQHPDERLMEPCHIDVPRRLLIEPATQVIGTHDGDQAHDLLRAQLIGVGAGFRSLASESGQLADVLRSGDPQCATAG